MAELTTAPAPVTSLVGTPVHPAPGEVTDGAHLPPPAEAAPQTPEPSKQPPKGPDGKFVVRDRSQRREAAIKAAVATKAIEPPKAPPPPAAEPKADAKHAAKPAEGTPVPKAADAAAKPETPPADDLEGLEREWAKARRERKKAREAQAEVARWRAEQAELAMLKEADPYAYLERQGFNFRQVAEAAVKKETATPEQRALSAAEQKVADLEKRLAAQEARLQREAQSAAVENLRREAKQAIDREAYPTLAKYYDADDVAEAATTIRLNAYRERGLEMSVNAALALAEKRARQEYERFLRTDPAESPGESPPRRASNAGSKERNSGPARPAVTNTDASVRAQPPAGLTVQQRRERAEAAARGLLRRH